MKYSVCGKISFNVDFEIEADSEEEAVQKAKEMIEDYYHFNSIGSPYQDESEVKFNLDVYEYE